MLLGSYTVSTEIYVPELEFSGKIRRIKKRNVLKNMFAITLL